MILSLCFWLAILLVDSGENLETRVSLERLRAEGLEKGNGRKKPREVSKGSSE